ncbi:MAG: oxygenase MpaB family protein [Acidimicrobiia bacterium]
MGAPDPGFFGPASITWRVNQEITVLFGGARALLMHAAHPLVAAGARQTAMYQRDPWARLLRTIQLQSAVTFGRKEDAKEAADRINQLHRRVHGVDSATGERYDALDPGLLLWVHAALEVSSLYFYERTVQPLSEAERQAYHEEGFVAAELVLLPASCIPPTIGELETYVGDTIASDRLLLTDVARDVARMVRSGPVPLHIRPLWRFISFAAFGTLPEPLRDLYEVKWSLAQSLLLDANLRLVQRGRPWLPRRFRLIKPALWASERLEQPKEGLGAPSSALIR